MPLHLLQLPFEILRAIVKELHIRQQRFLRLVCRQLDQVAFDFVGRRNFAHLLTDLTPTRLQRLYGISRTDHINRCVKNLCIEADWCWDTPEKLQDFFDSEKVVEDIFSGNTKLNFKILELEWTYLTLKVIKDVLFSNHDSLHTLIITGTVMVNGGKWTDVFADMVGNFPHLRDVTIDPPLEYDLESDTYVCNEYSRLAEYPVVPGSEKKTRYGHPKIDKRQIDALLHPIELRYTHNDVRTYVHRVSYSGPDMDQFLLILVKAADPQ